MTQSPSDLPKYLQLAEFLIREIRAERYAVGSRLPPERALASSLNVAVGTLRKALGRLREQGVIEAVQGSGNYIKDVPQGSAIYSFFPLERPDGGGLPRARLISFDRHAKPAYLPGFGTGSDAHRIRRLRLLDDTIVAAEEVWLDRALAPDLRASDLSESLYLTYRDRLRLWITATSDRVGLGQVPDWAPDIGLSPGAPCGFFDRVSRAGAGPVPEVSQTWFNPARARYVARRP